MARPVLALLTDFGLADHYVAAMKGVILGVCRDAAIIDISHDIPPQDVLAGALELEAVVPCLPAGTVVVGVVDPGVGSERRGIAVQSGSLSFVGPDNGLFSFALRRTGPGRAVSLVSAGFGPDRVSRTFEGRDRFAPAAAWLARGTAIEALGPLVDDLVQLPTLEPAVTGVGLDGQVVRIDRFGNLITNIREPQIAALAGCVSILVAGRTIDGLSDTYAAAPPGGVCALIGSTSCLEISVNGGNAADLLGASRGTAVRVRVQSGA
ncbi:MAG TPA: SAM-dependent chlorinase/fluorinase [Vicinamibacterales bacterium]|nr:SAM-dependent chlorinase/fluorinase [Vicinamibacterales bacterium]